MQRGRSTFALRLKTTCSGSENKRSLPCELLSDFNAVSNHVALAPCLSTFIRRLHCSLKNAALSGA
jgi:hypothetical protein